MPFPFTPYPDFFTGANAWLRVRTVLWCLLAGFLIGLSQQATASMFGLFKRYDAHLSPEVNGQIKKDGQVMPGLNVFRELHYDDNRHMDKTTTDDEGRFYFPEKNIRSRGPGRWLVELRNVQFITADLDDQTFLLWHVATDNIKRSKTLEEKLSQLNCDLNDEKITHHFTIYEHPNFIHNIGSICRW